MTLSELSACCGSSVWAQQMSERQPFVDRAAMHQAADEVWWSLTTEDWLEAFSKHPQIGRRSTKQWSSEQQSGMSQAALETSQEMAELNAQYLTKFGFIFIVCATGKSAGEMLRLLQLRLNGSREEEIRNAAGEQAKITHMRLDKL